MTAVGLAAAEELARPIQRLLPGVAAQLERDSVRGGDADQRRAADLEAFDRRGDVGGRAELELLLTPRQDRLVERPERLALEPKRHQSGAGRAHPKRFSIDSGGACSGS